MRSKKIFWGLLLLLVTLLPLYAQYDSESDFRVELSEDKNSVLITRYLGNKQNVSIPPKIQELPVREITAGAFSGCDITSITIPNSVTKIGEGAFTDCENITAINADVKNKTYSSQDGVLYNKNKTILIMYPVGKKGSFLIPNNVQSIEVGAFFNCANLTSVTIPESVTEIGRASFMCSGLISVTIPNNVQSIGVGAFCGCVNLTDVIIGNNVTKIGNGAFLNCVELKKVIIPNKVKTIEAATVRRCDNLTDVIIGNSVTKIKEEAFFICNSLTEITIPKSVTTIEKEAFNFCKNLVSVRFEGAISYNEFGDKAFLGDLRDKFYATDAVNGTPGTYTTTAPVDGNSVWTKK
jgi:hypothetical protein